MPLESTHPYLYASALEGIHVLAMSNNDARLGGRQMGRVGRKIFDPAPDGSLPKNAQVRRAQSAVVKPLRRRISIRDGLLDGMVDVKSVNQKSHTICRHGSLRWRAPNLLRSRMPALALAKTGYILNLSAADGTRTRKGGVCASAQGTLTRSQIWSVYRFSPQPPRTEGVHDWLRFTRNRWLSCSLRPPSTLLSNLPSSPAAAQYLPASPKFRRLTEDICAVFSM